MRALIEPMEEVLKTGTRRPAFKIYAFDPALDSMGEIVRGNYSQEPYDLTSFCTNISWTPAKLSFTLADPQGLFHPDTGVDRAYLRDGAIIRLREGDERVPEELCPWTFTGLIRGQVGWQKARKSQNLEAKVTAFSRENSQSLKRRKITSKEYTVGTELGVFLYDICETFLGLSPEEIRIPPVLGLQLRHRVNQIAQMAPWEAVSTILETVGKVPYFDGDGRLACLDKNLQRLPDRVLPDYIRIHDYQIPERSQDSINKVKVVFLDSVLERVNGPYQKLGQAQVTTGFFSMHETLNCWWSEDRKQRASGTSMRVLKSVNSGILPVGSEHYTQIDEFHGRIDVDIDTWVAVLASVMLIEYSVAAIIPDMALVFNIGFGVSVGEGITISVGRLIQAQAMAVLLLIMMSMGSAQYEIWGTPYDYAYLEKTATAIEEGLNYWEENEKEIKNDFLGTYEQADNLAIRELVWEKSNSYPRKLIIDDDLALEIGDIVVLPDGRKFMITGMSKNIRRGEVPILALDGFKVMTA
ncbi:MAG: hypothetical protein C4567_13145 [Deltaproteobacteria bacterium]|nr:MAG: hypothetical protein C4567_13145 [Deltaproteobacteria bacterium]